MKNKILKFPDGFLWGAAISAHQVEGGTKNDWTEWEKKNAERLAEEAKTKWAPWQQKKFPEMFNPENYISGQACDHYNRYEEDLDIAKSLGLNAFRISIEWSRVEPEEGKFDEREIEHYRKVLKAIRFRGMEPFVTLWHYTLPLWLSRKKGILNRRFPNYLARYAKRITREYKNLCDHWITLNEPSVIVSHAYLEGIRPPQKKSLFLSWKACKKIMQAHNNTYEAIKEVSEKNKVGFANHIKYFKPYRENSLLDKLAVKVADYFGNWIYYDLSKGKNDFMGLQHYFVFHIKFPGKAIIRTKNLTDLRWEIYPEGIYYILNRLKKYDLPIYITECGLADAEDLKREKYIKENIFWIHKAISERINIKGFLYWSFIDNFEWDKGSWPRFGLVEVDYKTMKRKIRPSAQEYAKICRNNSLEI